MKKKKNIPKKEKQKSHNISPGISRYDSEYITLYMREYRKTKKYKEYAHTLNNTDEMRAYKAAYQRKYRAKLKLKNKK